MLNKEDILALAWEHSEGSGKRYTFTEESLFAFLEKWAREKAPAQDEPFAWATFDGEGSYDLRLYENNEDYRDDYLKLNTAPMYQGWVFPLYAANHEAEPAPSRRAATVTKEENKI